MTADNSTTRRLALTAEPILVNAAGAAALCGVSQAVWKKLVTDRKVPPAMKYLGPEDLWLVVALRAWAESGCAA